MLIKCEYCNKEFNKPPSHIQRDKHHFCNKSHSGKWRSKTYQKEGNPNWKGGYQSKWSKIYYEKNKYRLRRSSLRWRLKTRLEVIKHYGEKCQCCGETTLHFLGVDHINGGGYKHRKSINKSWIYSWLKQNNYPDGFRILCHNCNLAKGFYGKCPHEN